MKQKDGQADKQTDKQTDRQTAKTGNQTTTLSLWMWPQKYTMSKRKDDHAPVPRLNC